MYAFCDPYRFIYQVYAKKFLNFVINLNNLRDHKYLLMLVIVHETKNKRIII